MNKIYTVKWPTAANHQTKSQSGVLVETNVQGQVALHFFNEFRQLEEQIQYDMEGGRTGDSRDITYVREISDTILISETSARQLRDVLSTLFAEPAPETLM